MAIENDPYYTGDYIDNNPPSPTVSGLSTDAAASGGGTALASGDGTFFSSLFAVLPSLTSSIASAVSGPQYAKPGQVLINPATGQPYPVGTQLAGSGLFSSPVLLIGLLIIAIFAFGGKK